MPVDETRQPTRAELRADLRFYVYVHQDRRGRIFYVGKGTGGRAWSEDRDDLWKRYVETRLHGHYEVRIVAYGLQEHDALLREERLMTELADQVVNRQNMGRGIDLQTNERITAIQQQRDQAFLQGTQSTSAVDRVRLFRDAIEHHRAASCLSSEKGIVGELLKERPLGHFASLDSLIRAQIDLGDATGAEQSLKEYSVQFPASGDTAQFHTLMAKVERLKVGKRVAGTALTATFRPADPLPSDWEWALEDGIAVARLRRSLRLGKGGYLETVEPAKALRREKRYAEVLALMKAAIVDAEMKAEHKNLSMPPYYTMEGAKACRSLGNAMEECLLLYRFIHHATQRRRADSAISRRLGIAAARLSTASR